MKTSVQVRQQIQKLEKEASSLAAKESGAVAARIREAIAYYHFTPDDLFKTPRKTRVTSGTKAVKKAAQAPKSGKVAIKYRDNGGNTWTGRGSRPRWLVAELASGKTIENFAI